MSGRSIGVYRLAALRPTRVGEVKIVFDRHRQAYLAGSKVVNSVARGEFLILTTADGQLYSVKAQEFSQLQQAGRKPR